MTKPPAQDALPFPLPLANLATTKRMRA